MADELIDIYDIDMNPIGTAMKSQAHREGLWHKAFHCWIVKRSPDRDHKVWLQLRGKTVRHPNLLDISSAGHLKSGEVPKDGIKEIEKELGLKINFDHLTKLFTEKHVYNTPEYINHEFDSTYLLETDKNLSDITLDPENVDGIFEVSVKDLYNIFNNKVSRIFISGYVRNEHGRIEPQTGSVEIKDFVAHDIKYYQKVIKTIEQYFKGN